MNIDARIAQANGRLKSVRVGISIEQKGSRLYLRGTLPPRPSSSQKQAYQQRISLGVHANPSGVKMAESEARKVGALLDCKQFEWQPYIKIATATPQTVSEWIEQFEVNYFQNRERNDKTLTTWNGYHIKVLRKLSKDVATYGLRNHEVFRLDFDLLQQGCKVV